MRFFTSCRTALVALAVITIAVALLCTGCQTARPSAELVKAMRVVETQVDIYVEEANWALEQAEHPDAAVLVGTGLRIRNAVKALSWWAQEAAGDHPGAPSTPGTASTATVTKEGPVAKPTP